MRGKKPRAFPDHPLRQVEVSVLGAMVPEPAALDGMARTQLGPKHPGPTCQVCGEVSTPNSAARLWVLGCFSSPSQASGSPCEQSLIPLGRALQPICQDAKGPLQREEVSFLKCVGDVNFSLDQG